jgi:putative chitobiose transport system permease protein
MTQEPRLQRAVRVTVHYAVLVAIALVCAFPLLWTLSVAIGTQGNVFAFPLRWCRAACRWPIRRGLPCRRPRPLLLEFGVDHVLDRRVDGARMRARRFSLARYRFRGRRLVFGVILATLMLPTEVNFLVNFITAAHLRLVNTHLGVILPTIAGAIGIFILKTAFEEIPQDLLDAARVDGASELYIFLRVMLPLAAPQIGALVILTAVTTWNQFLWPSVVLTKSELMPLAVGILELSGTFGSATRVIAAGAVLTIAPALIVFFFAQRYFMRGMEGAVK